MSAVGASRPAFPLRARPRDPGAEVTGLGMRERCALALLAVSGAAFLPLALNRFVFPKLAVFAAGLLLASTAPARGRLPRSVWAIVGLGGLLLSAAALTGATPAAQLLGRPPRYEGWVVLPLYVGALWAGARLLGPQRPGGATACFLRWLSVAAVAVGIESVLEAAGLRPLVSDVARPGSLLGNASDQGAWGVLAVGPLAAVALRAGGRLRAAGALAAAATVVCSGSRGALLGIVVTAVVLIVLTPWPSLRLVLAIGAAAVAVGVFVLPPTRARITGTSPLSAETASGRRLLWGETLHLLGDRPLLGAGPSGFIDSIPRYHSEQYEREVGPANPPESPHDVLLQAASSGGLVLALLAVALAWMTASSGLAARAAQPTGGEAAFVCGMLAALAGYGTALLFFFTTPGSTALAALMAGALLARAAPGAAGPSSADVAADPARDSGAAPGVGRRWAPHRGPAGRAAARAALFAILLVYAAAAAAEVPLRSAIAALADDRLAAARAEFRLAHELRPWDPAVAAVAAHAYAALTRDGVASAAREGFSWSSEATDAYPDWVQALTDRATIEAALGHSGRAERLAAKARALDPRNPDLSGEGGL